MMQPVNDTTVKQRWHIAFGEKKFRNKFIAVFILLLITLSCLPAFFQHIEKRNGAVLNDIMLNNIKPYNVSLYIFAIIWLVTILMLLRALQQPGIFMVLLLSFTLLTISRIVSISCFALNPPLNLIPLKDPLSNFFYGNTFITKDLFFSGHTATMFLMYLCLTQKPDKYIALTATFLVGFLVLLQHVHYSVDVLAAPLLTYIIYRIAKAWV
jgi:membrane-associated phospholipid phosphatase